MQHHRSLPDGNDLPDISLALVSFRTSKIQRGGLFSKKDGKSHRYATQVEEAVASDPRTH